jgi:alpha-1,6-mannosyltransferase
MIEAAPAARRGQAMTQLGDGDWRAPAVLALAGAALLALCIPMLQFLGGKQYEAFVGVALIQCSIYALALWFVLSRRRGRRTLGVILAVAVLARAIALLAPDALSTDVYRYIWDGRVQSAGINPYRYVPTDPALASLHDEDIYPNINRAEYAPTIYPPVAQMIFLLVTRIQQTATAIKLAMLGFEAVAIGAILAVLRADGLPPERVLIYAWHPLPIWEFSGAGHVDAAAVAFLCLAMLAAMRGRGAAAGGILALATLVKPFVAVIAPALWNKWDWRMPAAFVAGVVLCYLPYLGAGRQVFGFLGGYSSEEGYLEGGGFFLVALLRRLGAAVPESPLSASVAAAVLAALAIFIALRARRQQVDPWGPVLLATCFLVLISPHFAWYFAWPLPLLCRRIYLPLLYLTLACFILYLPEIKDWSDYFKAGLWLYGGFAILAFGDWMMRVTQPAAERAR